MPVFQSNSALTFNAENHSIRWQHETRKGGKVLNSVPLESIKRVEEFFSGLTERVAVFKDESGDDLYAYLCIYFIPPVDIEKLCIVFDRVISTDEPLEALKHLLEGREPVEAKQFSAVTGAVSVTPSPATTPAAMFSVSGQSSENPSVAADQTVGSDRDSTRSATKAPNI